MLTDRVALVTGSTSGIGLGIAQGLAAEGCHLVINGFGDGDEIESIRARLAEQHGVQVQYSGADMSRPDEIAALIAQAQTELGGLDIVVNNAGIQFVSKIEEFPAAKWDAILAINLSSAFHTIRLSISAMKAKGWGRIVNVASAHALVASPFKSAYVAAKHGIVGLTKTVALEAAEQGVTCNAICPGYVHTPLVDLQIEDTAKARGITREQVIKDVMLGEQPTKRFVTIQEVADLTLFLCSDSGASINGAALTVDGGWTAH
jgi:3-hydroxybutyrate dehydrogenase